MPPAAPPPRRHIGGYRILRELGGGGMGQVYLGEDDTGRHAAVKVIRSGLAGDPHYLARLRREVEAARSVPRFCTAPVLAADLDSDPPYVATEYIDAPTLAEAVAARGPLRGADLDGLAVGVAVALRAIHDHGVVHRDLKPSNILLSSVGPRVIDFGIARRGEADPQLTQAGTTVGTLAYMAPEQLRGDPVTPAVDVFAWATVLYYAARGEPPFGADQDTTPGRILHEHPDLGGLDRPLRDLVGSAFHKNPAQRPSASRLVNRLFRRAPDASSRVLRDATEPTRSDPAPPRFRPGRVSVSPPRPAPAPLPRTLVEPRTSSASRAPTPSEPAPAPSGPANPAVPDPRALAAELNRLQREGHLWAARQLLERTPGPLPHECRRIAWDIRLQVERARVLRDVAADADDPDTSWQLLEIRPRANCE